MFSQLHPRICWTYLLENHVCSNHPCFPCTTCIITMSRWWSSEMRIKPTATLPHLSSSIQSNPLHRCTTDSTERTQERTLERTQERTLERTQERTLEWTQERTLERTWERTLERAVKRTPENPWRPIHVYNINPNLSFSALSASRSDTTYIWLVVFWMCLFWYNKCGLQRTQDKLLERIQWEHLWTQYSFGTQRVSIT